MKKKRKEPALDYGAEIRKLKEQGPRRLYLLWGEEDYLRDDYMKTLREICAADEAEGFQSRIFKQAQPDPVELRFAIDTLPFFSERSLIEIREMDYMKPGDADWTRVTAASGRTATYTLTAQAKHDGYVYYCKVTNAAGTAESDTATLTVYMQVLQ